MKATLQICIMIVTVICTGCVPYRFTAKTGASGYVTDAQTGATISQAAIALKGGGLLQNQSSVSSSTNGFFYQSLVYSSTNGFFYVAPEHVWGILPLGPLREARWTTEIAISAPGYIAYTQNFSCSGLSPNVIKLGRVKLTHQQ